MKFKFILAAAVIAASTALSAQPRVETSLNNNWKFSIALYGDYKQYDAFSDGPTSAYFGDSNWRVVNLPNDWAIDLPNSPTASFHNGHKSIGWQYVENSTAWYRKHFEIPSGDKGKKLSLRFEKISGRSDIFVNGILVGSSLSTSVPFEIEISDYVKYGSDNLLAVKVDAFSEEAATYRGAGITGGVSLVTSGKLAIGGGSLRTENCNRVGTNAYMLDVCATVNNASDSAEGMFGLTFSLFDERGKNVAKSETFYSVVPEAGQSLKVQRQLPVTNPFLWSDFRPYLYTVRCELSYNNDVVDECEIKTGIRDIDLDTASGLTLNGKPFKAFGAYVCPDFGGVGTGVPAELWESRIRLLKTLGCNMLRFTSGAATPAALDMCDRLGILVIEDCGATLENGAGDVEAMVLRDASHPCFVAWNVPVPQWSWKEPELADSLCERMAARLAILDPGHPAASYAECCDWMDGLFVTPAFNYRGSAEEMAWPNNITSGGLVDYSGHITARGEEFRMLATGRASKEYRKELKNAPKAGRPFRVEAVPSAKSLSADGQSIITVDVTVLDEKDRVAAGLPVELTVYVDADPLSPYESFTKQSRNPLYDPITILGYSNGDPAFAEIERPTKLVTGEFRIKTYEGRAQLILRSVDGASGKAHVRVGGSRLHGASLTFEYR